MQGQQRKPSSQENEIPKDPVNVDEQVIPTMNNNKSKGGYPQEYEYGQEDDKEAEELTGDKIV